jgi:hypothetical protein
MELGSIVFLASVAAAVIVMAVPLIVAIWRHNDQDRDDRGG